MASVALKWVAVGGGCWANTDVSSVCGACRGKVGVSSVCGGCRKKSECPQYCWWVDAGTKWVSAVFVAYVGVKRVLAMVLVEFEDSVGVNSVCGGCRGKASVSNSIGGCEYNVGSNSVYGGCKGKVSVISGVRGCRGESECYQGYWWM